MVKSLEEQWMDTQDPKEADLEARVLADYAHVAGQVVLAQELRFLDGDLSDVLWFDPDYTASLYAPHPDIPSDALIFLDGASRSLHHKPGRPVAFELAPQQPVEAPVETPHSYAFFYDQEKR